MGIYTAWMGMNESFAAQRWVVVRVAQLDDEFVRGIMEIYNDTPIRQGRRYLHYGKDFEALKREFSRFLFREEIFGAYLGKELLGFIMLADAGRYASLSQIISKIAYRELAPTNALLAKAVHAAQRKTSHTLFVDIGLMTAWATSSEAMAFKGST
jgi:hypothetical protein